MAARKMPPVLDALRHWSPKRTVVFAMLGDESPVPADIIDAVRKAGVPFFRSPERALRTIARFTAWSEQQHRKLGPARKIAASESLPAGIIPEYAAKTILQQAGLAMPARQLVGNVGDAIAAAQSIGFPVALKIQSAALSHKSDVGGVILGINDTAALQAGWDRLFANIATAAAAACATIDGVLVERMSGPGLELILGARNDPDWGPVLAVGLGGIFAEALKDICLLPAGAASDQIKSALLGLKGAALLGAFRGKPPRDLDAIAAAVEALGAFMSAHPEIGEVDINPLIAFAEGEGVLALDALISCREGAT
jgi:acyl-CoA synthetase (NDP forming)